MLLKFFASLMLGLITVTAFAASPRWLPKQEAKSFLRFDGSMRSMSVGAMDQKIDHANSASRTFKQRYFIDSGYAEGPDSPVFYIICGEWHCAGTGSYTMAERLAKESKAHLVALEHRFYGESHPFAKLTTANLRTLNLETAVEDLASFQRWAMAKFNLQGKWVSFGGSYAGTLSAFYRLRHPELVVGALASSAPVIMKAEFSEYDAHVARVLESAGCLSKVHEAIAQVESKIRTPEGVAEAKELFNASDIRETDDFMYVVADILAGAVQYGNHRAFCKTLLASPDALTGYAKGSLSVLAGRGESAFEQSFQSAETLSVKPESFMRQWMWQSCNEFGWFQVANSNAEGSARSDQVDLNYHDRVCARLFGIPRSANGSINAQWYFPLMSASTNHVIMTNGGNDPWQRLSVVSGDSPSNPNLNLFMMAGASHCSDLDSYVQIPTVLAAQTQFSAIIKGWLDIL